MTMAFSKFEPTWKLMSTYNFKVDDDDKHLYCQICNKLMKDACEGVCGCHYCFDCINEYLCDGSKCCPGGKEQCNQECMVMERDVFRNFRLNNDIYKVMVLCPNETCQSKIKLSELEDHFRVCIKQPIECPYLNIGCDSDRTHNITLLAHLNNDLIPHTQLLIEYIQNLKNEFDGLRQIVEKNKVEICSLKNETRIKDIKFDEVIQQMAEQKHEMEYIKMESKEKENRIVTLEEQLRNEIDLRVNGEMNEIMRMMEEQKGEIGKMQNTAAKERDQLKMELVELKKEMNEVKLKSDDNRERRMNNFVKLCPIADANIVWRIEDYSKKRGIIVFSDSFSANKYKMCLYLCARTDDNVRLYCCIMKGDHDDEVAWPMTRAVTLDIIDQDTMRAQWNVTFKHSTHKGDKKVFDRPTKDMNESICCYCWSINDSAALCVNDSIVVSCTVTDP